MRRARVPTLWLFTDERLGGRNPGDPLWAAVQALPHGAGIVFRHYGWAPPERQALLQKLEAVARRRHLILIGSGIRGASGGRHLSGAARSRHRPVRGLLTAAAHDRRELLQGFRLGADLIFLSPAFPTRSHPGAPALGPLRWAALARRAASSAVALGGMDARSARRLPNWACGMAALEGLLPASHSVSQKSRPRDPGHCPFRMA